MAKIRGIKRWERNTKSMFSEAIACEIKLDSLHQKLKKTEHERDLSRALGHIRRILAKIGWQQKTLKRWVKPAPNQEIKQNV